ADEDLAGSRAATSDYKRRASCLRKLSQLGANLHGQGIAKRHAGPFGQAVNFFNKMQAMLLEERQEPHRPRVQLLAAQAQQAWHVIKKHEKLVAALLAVLAAQFARRTESIVLRKCCAHRFPSVSGFFWACCHSGP